MPQNQNKNSVVDHLKEIARFAKLNDQSVFEISAYQKAYRVLRQHQDQIKELVDQNNLKSLAGIGNSIAKIVQQFFELGTSDVYQNLKSNLDPALVELTQLAEIGPKKAKVLIEELGIRNLGELKYACNENRLQSLKGFGLKTQQKISKNLIFFEQSQGFLLRPHAIQQAQLWRKALDGFASYLKIVQVGSLARKLEVINSIEFLVWDDQDRFFNHKEVSLRDQPFELVFQNNFLKIFEVCPQKSAKVKVYASTRATKTFWQHHLSASQDYLVDFYQKNKISFASLSDPVPSAFYEMKNPREIYQSLRENYVAPELREGPWSLARDDSQVKLIENQDLKGLFHMHTLASDGQASLEQLQERMIELGYEYMGVSDHSQTSFYANGLSVAEIKKQHQQIDALNKRHPDFRILKGIEADILPDGQLDYENEILAQFDFVIASVHQQLNMEPAKMTERILKALENPYTTMLGHPTGRLLLARAGYQADWEAIFKKAAKQNVVLEINASPYRLDLSWSMIKRAKKLGVLFSINPDAHRLEGLEDSQFGVDMARKAGLESKDIINSLRLIELKKIKKVKLAV